MSKYSRKARATVAAAALCSAPSVARADFTFSPGINFSVSFGRKVTVGIGMDVRATDVIVPAGDYGCGDNPRAGLGPYAQAGWFSDLGWRLGFGVQGGGEINETTFVVDGELGWVYQFRHDEVPGSNGLHLGLILQFAPATFNGVAAVQVPIGADFLPALPSGAVQLVTGVGVRAPSIFGSPLGMCLSRGGRPLRSGGDIVLPAVRVRGPAPRRHPFDAPDDFALAAAWLDEARAECASVPAFMALARDLANVGAPSGLAARAREAAREEIRHTALCRGLASRFSGIDATPVLPRLPASEDRDRATALVRMAVEAWTDGCIGEGGAAARALYAAQGASDESAQNAQFEIARDEARHAELAWSVLAFCLEAGGRHVRDAVAERVSEREPESVNTRDDHADPALLRSYGIADRAIGERAREAIHERAGARVRALLA